MKYLLLANLLFLAPLLANEPTIERYTVLAATNAAGENIKQYDHLPADLLSVINFTQHKKYRL